MGLRMTTDISAEFRRVYGQQTACATDTSIKGVPDSKVKPANEKSRYQIFLEKYADLENHIDSFKTQDIVYFFREKSKEAGARYIIANMKRDMGIFKKLQENFSVPEILLMIEFIFSGDQTYLDVNRTQPTVLASNWVNTIYQDSILWSKDRYTEVKRGSSKSRTEKREWSSSNTDSKIGEW